MKILHVIPYCAPAWAYGGPPRAVHEIAKHQVQQGHDVQVLTTTAFTKDKMLPVGRTTAEGYTLTRLQNFNNWLMWRMHFSTPLRAKEYFSTNSFDVVHLHEARTLLNHQTVRHAKTKSFFFSPWGTLPYNDSQLFIKKIFDAVLMRSIFKSISASFAQTTHEKQTLSEFKVNGQHMLLPLGISISDFEKLPSQEKARTSLGLEKNTFYFLFLGRFSPQKGLKHILQAFSKVHETHPECKLLLVGRDDGYLDQIHKDIQQLNLQNHVVISKPLYDTDRLLAYRAANALVFAPTVYEETGTVCLEALACGIPVITTKEAQIPFLSEADGVTESENTPPKLTAHMIRLLSNKITVNQEKLRNHFDWKSIASAMLEQYQKAYVKQK